MFLWFFLTSIILTFISSQENEIFYYFTLDKKALSKCIENYLVNCNDSYYKNTGVAKNIADLMANRFFGRTKTKRDLSIGLNHFFYELKKRKSYLFKNQQIDEGTRLLIREALVICNKHSPGHLLPTPIFTNERPEIGAVLNYILVDWPVTSLYDMIRTRNGRAILRRYAEDAGVKLALALNSVMDHDYFRYLLRSHWNQRAERYFNGKGGHTPYLRHRYSTEHPFPHTYDMLTYLVAQNSYYLSDRNPFISYREFDRIMQIHVADRRGYGEYDVFSTFDRSGTMSSARYYLETHIDQFYRIQFFFMELQIHGISSDYDDVYEQMLPLDVIPFRIQEILCNDVAYRNYLLTLRRQLEVAMTNNPRFPIEIGRSLSSARVREEDLISLLSLWAKYNRPGGTNSSTFITFKTISSTTPKYDYMKRKGSVSTNENEKHFCQHLKTTSSGNSQQQNQNNNRHYGYITYNEDSPNQMHFKTENFKAALSIKDNYFATVNDCFAVA